MSVSVGDEEDRYTRCRDLVRDTDHRASSLTRGVQMSVDVGVLGVCGSESKCLLESGRASALL